MRNKLCLMLLLFIGFILLPNDAAAAGKPTVIIDPGHGGMYGGTVGYSGNRTGYYEKHANLEVSKRLKTELEKRGFIVKMTRSTDTQFSRTSANQDLIDRMKVANGMIGGNNDNTVFISVHHNATSSPTYGGYETYYFNKNYASSSYPPSTLQMHYSPESQRLAEDTHRSVISSGVKEGRGIVFNSLYVTRAANMPSVLLEVGYMSNPTEEAMIKTASFQTKIAANVAKGVDKFFNVYVVNDANGKALKHFASKTDALNYSKNVKSSYVTYKKTGAIVSSASTPAPAPAPTPAPAPKIYGVYHTHGPIENNLFSSQSDAISYAGKWKNTRVINTTTGEILWSNYLTAKFKVMNSSGTAIKSFYTEDDAIAYAKKQTSVYVIDSSNDNLLWSNYVNKYKNFIVKSKEKGTMIEMYNREEAKDYADLWGNTSVTDKWANKVIHTSPNTTPYSYKSKNLSGADRILTAIQVSKQLYPNGIPTSRTTRTAIIATSGEFADALSAGPLADHYGNAPILLNRPAKLSAEVEAELKRLKVNHVILVGGTGALSTTVENRLKTLGIRVERLSGATRYETNEKINAKLPAYDGLFVVSGSNYPDAISAASIAVVKNWPIVMVNNDGDVPSRLNSAFGKEVIIVGGTGAVPAKTEQAVGARIGTDRIERLSGKNRYETLKALLEEYSKDFASSQLIVSTGANYPDALVSSALSARYNAPLVLVPGTYVPDGLKETVETHSTEKLITETFYVGGAVSTSLKNTVNAMQN